MTPRAYWDRHGRLWEESSDSWVIILVWSTTGDVSDWFLIDNKDLIDEIHGPLVGVA